MFKNEFNPNQYTLDNDYLFIYHSVHCHYTAELLVFDDKAEFTPIPLGNTSTSKFDSPIHSHNEGFHRWLEEESSFVMVIGDSFPQFPSVAAGRLEVSWPVALVLNN